MTVIAFLRAAPDRKAADFKHWYASEFAPRFNEATATLRRHVVNVTEQGPEALRLSYDSADPLARYDVVAELAWANVDPRRAFRAYDEALVAWADVRHGYLLSSTVVLDAPRASREPLPGIKLFRELLFYMDMSDEAVKRCWAHHAKLAVRVHTGAARYVRHWVDERLSPGLPPIRGVVEFYFPTAEDLVERYYQSPEGKQAIIHDTGHFIHERLPRAYARETAVMDRDGGNE